MFRSLRYCNIEKIHEYYAIITGKKRLSVKNVNMSDEKGASLSLSVIGGSFHGKTTIDATMEENLNLDYDIFEQSLSGRDDYFDTLQKECDLDTVLQGTIIKFQANMQIPQEFDIIQLFEQFKPMLLKQANSQMESDAYHFLENAMEKDDVKMPVVFDLDEICLYGKISSKYLLIDYDELEDFESDDITVLAKVIAHKKDHAEIYDPLKDFIKLSRAMRRHGGMNTLPSELSKIYIDKDAISLEILAIYQ